MFFYHNAFLLKENSKSLMNSSAYHWIYIVQTPKYTCIIMMMMLMMMMMMMMLMMKMASITVDHFIFK